MSGYPGYHTGFETFDLVDRIYDPEFKVFISFLVLHKEFKLEGQFTVQVFRACAQLNLRLSLQLAESTLLPLKMEPYAKVNFTTSRGKNFESGDGGRCGILGEFWGFEPSEAVGNCYNPLGRGSLGIQVHIPHPFTPNRIHSKLRERAEQFDAYALEVAANRPESLRLINDQVNPQIFIQFNK